MNIEKEKLQKIMLDLKRAGGFIKIVTDYNELFVEVNMLDSLEDDIDYLTSLTKEDTLKKGGIYDKRNN